MESLGMWNSVDVNLGGKNGYCYTRDQKNNNNRIL